MTPPTEPEKKEVEREAMKLIEPFIQANTIQDYQNNQVSTVAFLWADDVIALLMAELVESIKTKGVIYPLTVRKFAVNVKANAGYTRQQVDARS